MIAKPGEPARSAVSADRQISPADRGGVGVRGIGRGSSRPERGRVATALQARIDQGDIGARTGYVTDQVAHPPAGRVVERFGTESIGVVAREDGAGELVDDGPVHQAGAASAEVV